MTTSDRASVTRRMYLNYVLFIFSDRTENVEGKILVNGLPRNNAQFRKMSCYIMQDDVLLPHLSVLEAMRYAAQLKLPRKMSKEEKEAVVSKWGK